MVRRTPTIRFFALLLLVLLLVLWVGMFAGESGAGSSSFRFAVVADSRSNKNDSPMNAKLLRQLIGDMNALHPAFCRFPGDLLFDDPVGTDAFKKRLQDWITDTGQFRSPLYVSPGNHEFKGGAGRADKVCSFARPDWNYHLRPVRLRYRGRQGANRQGYVLQGRRWGWAL